jgi:hypothetical protein
MRPVCPMCLKPMSRGWPDWTGVVMHEAIITRGDVMKSPEEVKLYIQSRNNCVLVHPGKCDEMAHTVPGKKKCVSQLIEEEGEKNVIAFLERLAEIPKGQMAQSEIQFIKEISDGKEKRSTER